MFSNIHSVEGGKAIFDCVLLGSPRPRVLLTNRKHKKTIIILGLLAF